MAVSWTVDAPIGTDTFTASRRRGAAKHMLLVGAGGVHHDPGGYRRGANTATRSWWRPAAYHEDLNINKAVTILGRIPASAGVRDPAER